MPDPDAELLPVCPLSLESGADAPGAGGAGEDDPDPPPLALSDRPGSYMGASPLLQEAMNTITRNNASRIAIDFFIFDTSIFVYCLYCQSQVITC